MFSEGLRAGFSVGSAMKKSWQDKRINAELEALNSMDVQELPGDLPRYRLDNKVFATRPADYEIEYARDRRRSELLRQKGRDDLAESILSEGQIKYAQRAQQHADGIARRAQRLFYDDNGFPRSAEEIAANPVLQRELVSLFNDPLFEPIRNANGRLIRVTGVTPTPDGRMALDVAAYDPKSGKLISRGPITERRSSDDDDPVVLMSPEEMANSMIGFLRQKSEVAAKIDNTARALQGRRGLIRDFTDETKIVYTPATNVEMPESGGVEVSELDFSGAKEELKTEEAKPREDEKPGLVERFVTSVEQATGDVVRGLKDDEGDKPPEGEEPGLWERFKKGAKEVVGGLVEGIIPSAKADEPPPQEQPQEQPRLEDGLRSAKTYPLRDEPSDERPRLSDGLKRPKITDKASARQAARYYAEQAGIDPALFEGLIEQESGFNPNAVSPAGAVGLGQVMPGTGRNPGLGVKPLQDNSPEENLRFSAEYFKKLLDRYNGNVELALAAYNAGFGAVDKYGGIPPFEETQNYVKRVLARAVRIRGGEQPVTPTTAGNEPAARGGEQPVTPARTKKDDAAVDLATLYPNEVSIQDAARVRQTGTVLPPAAVPAEGRAKARSSNNEAVTEASQPEDIKGAKERRAYIDQIGKQVFGERYNSAMAIKTETTLDAIGMRLDDKRAPALLYHAERLTEAVTREMDGVFTSPPQFGSYVVGAAAINVGMEDPKEIVEKLVKPARAFFRGEPQSEVLQYRVMVALGTVQSMADVTPAEARDILLVAARYNIDMQTLKEHLAQARRQNIKLTADVYERALQRAAK